MCQISPAMKCFGLDRKPVSISIQLSSCLAQCLRQLYGYHHFKFDWIIVMNTIIMLPTVKILCQVCIAQRFCWIHSCLAMQNTHVTQHGILADVTQPWIHIICSDEGVPLIEYHVNSIFRIVKCITRNYFDISEDSIWTLQLQWVSIHS